MDRRTVAVDADLADRAQTIAESRGSTIGSVISTVLRLALDNLEEDTLKALEFDTLRRGGRPRKGE